MCTGARGRGVAHQVFADTSPRSPLPVLNQPGISPSSTSVRVHGDIRPAQITRCGAITTTPPTVPERHYCGRRASLLRSRPNPASTSCWSCSCGGRVASQVGAVTLSKRALENPGELYEGIVSLIPGLTSVELVEQGSDSVTIRTNEVLMKRMDIAKSVEADRVIVNSDESYEAGSKVTATTQFSEEFTTANTGVTYRLAMGDLEAPGFLGFFY